MRRAKLGFVCGVQVPILEALARHQVLSVALASVTMSVKRAQGSDGPQCESVKGLSPDIPQTVDADVFDPTEGNTRGAKEPGLPRVHRGRRPWHVTRAESGTREIPSPPPTMGVRWHNRQTGRKPDG